MKGKGKRTKGETRAGAETTLPVAAVMEVPPQEPELVVRFYDDDRRDVPAEVVAYLHCRQCLETWQKGGPEVKGLAPRDYARLEVGWTKSGFQVRCVRHDCNVLLSTVRAEKRVSDEGE